MDQAETSPHAALAGLFCNILLRVWVACNISSATCHWRDDVDWRIVFGVGCQVAWRVSKLVHDDELSPLETPAYVFEILEYVTTLHREWMIKFCSVCIHIVAASL